MSTNRIIVIDEKPLRATIFSAIERLDLANHEAVIFYIKNSYAAIKQNGYIEGWGDHTLLRELVAAEEKSGPMLTRKKISQLQLALDIFELHEAALSRSEHERIYYLVSVYNTVAAGFLDVREDNIELDRLFHENMNVCKLYSYDGNEHLKFFSHSLSRYASDIRLSASSTATEKKHLLIELARDMKILKLLIDKMLNLESEYTMKTSEVSKSSTADELRTLQEAILICASEAVKGNPEPGKWFCVLWDRVGDVAKKLESSGAKASNALFSPKFASIINKTILNDAMFKHFAEYYMKNAETTQLSHS